MNFLGENMEKDKLKHSDEDEDTLAQSTKKFKDSHSWTGGREYGAGNKKAIGYRDKLVGAILGAFEQAFGFESIMEEDLELNNEEE